MKIGYKNSTWGCWWREKNQEALMCFFGCFVCVFWCLEERKSVEKPDKEHKIRKNVFSLVWGVPKAIYSPDTHFVAAALKGLPVALQGPPALKGLKFGWSWHLWKYFDFLFPKRYGSWKSKGRIKSYDSQKLAVHRSIHHPSFHDILVVLTPISTHE